MRRRPILSILDMRPIAGARSREPRGWTIGQLRRAPLAGKLTPARTSYRIKKGADMNASRLLLVGVTLLSLAACASRAPTTKTESILEVIDQAESSGAAPQAQGKCPAGA